MAKREGQGRKSTISQDRPRRAPEKSLKAAILEILADPNDSRPPAEIEKDLGLKPGSLGDLLKNDPEFRARLGEALAARRELERLGLIKAVAAKAREGSIQHQKFYLELLAEGEGQPAEKEKMIVEFVVSEVRKG